MNRQRLMHETGKTVLTMLQNMCAGIEGELNDTTVQALQRTSDMLLTLVGFPHLVSQNITLKVVRDGTGRPGVVWVDRSKDDELTEFTGR